MKKMQVLILCGGKGTRLRPLTKTIPKPMLEFGGKPFLEYLIEYYKKNDIKDFILAVGYLKEQIVEYFGNGKKFGVNIKYSFEEKPLGTGGAVYNAKKYLKGNFIVVNGDTFTDFEPKDLLKSTTKLNKFLGVICVKKTTRSQNSGCVKFDDNQVITAFNSKIKTKNSFINTGIYLMTKKILKYFPNGACSLENDIFPKIKNQILAYPIENGYFIDMGTFKTFNQLQKEYKHLSNNLNLK